MKTIKQIREDGVAVTGPTNVSSGTGVAGLSASSEPGVSPKRKTPIMSTIRRTIKRDPNDEGDHEYR